MFIARRQRLYQITAAVLFALIAGAIMASILARDAQGATLTVMNTNDAGAGSLRQKIINAGAGDTIAFDGSLTGGTITLTSGELNISKNLTISGPAAGITVSGNNTSRVFNISSGVTVNISYLTVSGGSTSGGGGGIVNLGALNLTNSTVSGNSGLYGGGIYNIGATLNLTNSTVSGNSATINGGGMAIGATVNLTNSTVSGNSAEIGGGIFSNTGTLTLNNSTVSGNAAGNGGGIYNYAATINLTNSTVSGNSAGNGGGIYNTNSGAVTLANSIVANQVFGADCAGNPATSAGYNLVSDGSCNLIATGDLPNTNPMLAPLALNPPGSTRTHALQVGSPAIDAGDDNACPDTDQRGVARPQGAHCDIGAYEIGSAVPTAIWGNSDCLNGIRPDDALAVIAHASGIQQSSAQSTNCPVIGVSVGGGTWGNVDCLGGIDAVDAIAILKYFLGLTYDRAAGCTAIGDPIQLS